MSPDQNLEITAHGPVRLITLNRPEALNALTLGMIGGIRKVLADWRDDPGVQMVVFRGAGGRAFCAGGDVKAVYQAGVHEQDPDQRTALAQVYFAEEYRMNRDLFHYPKPLIAFMNGITMGGGFGVAGPCRIRVASEKTIFAMPEVGIGLFPDVGSMYSLTRCPDHAGAWLALTGETIGAADMLHFGLATHHIADDQFASILTALEQGGDPNTILHGFTSAPDLSHSRLIGNTAEMNAFFGGENVEGIVAALQAAATPFARAALKTIAGRSPTSLKLTHRYFQKMTGADFDTVTAMDFRLAMHCMLGHEFYEGIRAALIDRDKTPRWNPARLEDVQGDVIENYFGPDRWVLDKN